MVNSISKLLDSYYTLLVTFYMQNQDLMLILFIVYNIGLVTFCIVRHHVTEPRENIYAYTITRVMIINIATMGVISCLTALIPFTLACLFITLLSIIINNVTKLIKSILTKVED